ncbi:MAG: NAD(P)-dependent oxidoreductase [Porticoccaceae bacterium]|nr:NAD(P)-dependent oxidoreductase [Porticoccaceae bacterium]
MAAVLLAGCGDLGSALATRLVAAGHRVSAIKRSPPERPLPGVGYHCADLALGAPDLGGARFDQVLVILAPGSRDDDTYRALYDQGVARLVRALRGRVGHWFFVSSTSVYGQDAGEWVDEDSPAQPAAPTARHLLAAERHLAAAGAPATTIRFSGIYGPGRERFLNQIAAGAPVQYHPPRYGNRIHREDCIGVLEFLHRRALEGTSLAPRYLASDCCPAPLGAVARGLAVALGVPAPPGKGGGASNKRCRNDRLRALGYRFRFPDWRSGYLPLIEARRVRAAAASGGVTP